MLFDISNTPEDELESLAARSSPVSTIVGDPSITSNSKYIVIVIDPRDPMIREVPASSEKAFETLSDAKDAAREVIKESLNIASKSLANLRQIGIDEIGFIKL